MVVKCFVNVIQYSSALSESNLGRSSLIDVWFERLNDDYFDFADDDEDDNNDDREETAKFPILVFGRNL